MSEQDHRDTHVRDPDKPLEFVEQLAGTLSKGRTGLECSSGHTGFQIAMLLPNSTGVHKKPYLYSASDHRQGDLFASSGHSNYVYAFQDLHNLNLLSLYDNKLQTIAKGTFSPLRAIQTMHLAQNPFICDCHLKWLAEYLHTNPIETSGARCTSPRRLANKRIGQIKSKKFRCSAKEQYFIPGTEDYRSKLSGDCFADLACPEKCRCEGTTVDCSNQKLNKIPDHIPQYTAELRLNNNEFTVLEATGIFKKLPQLRKINFSNNKITDIEEGAFEGASGVNEILLTSNRLENVRHKMFKGLESLKTFNG
ncbi:hypothetical protein P7K49_006173 [Saguinus oedipus]|uniref:Uncharacterized protein n=1 Tax=Saguinus oedipus TaxID=9490 RepID=A0ABQ9W1M8_SAGOE|nr:hypothetical protein P7K49_006173 [Saguinus oedipus]